MDEIERLVIDRSEISAQNPLNPTTIGFYIATTETQLTNLHIIAEITIRKRFSWLHVHPLLIKLKEYANSSHSLTNVNGSEHQDLKQISETYWNI